MKITAKQRTQVRGYGVVNPNETIDIDSSRIDTRIKANFVRADGMAWEKDDETNPPPPNTTTDTDQGKKSLIDRTAERMGREAIISALEQSSIAFSNNENTKSLAKKYLRSIGEDV